MVSGTLSPLARLRPPTDILDRLRECPGRAFRRQLPEEVLEVAWSSPTGAREHDFGGMGCGHRGARERVVMDIHADVTRARLGHG
jgi:hypothetical protein